MGNIKLSPTKLNRYPIDTRFIDCSKKTSLVVTIDEKTADIKFESDAAVVPANGYFNKHYEDLLKLKKLELPKMVFHCLIDSKLEDNVIYVYDIICNDNFFSAKDIENVINSADTNLIKYCEPIRSGNLTYNDYAECKGTENPKILIVRPMWYPADTIWDPEVKDINTYSFAFGE